MNGHPNATAGGIAGGLGTLAVWLLNKYTGADLDVAESGAVVAGVSTVVLFIGRDGIAGAFKRLFWGNNPDNNPDLA